MANVTILDFPTVTDLQDDDYFYLVRGAGVDRDKVLKGSTLQEYIGDILLIQSSTAAIDLSTYHSNLLVISNPASPITLTFTNALPAGKKLRIHNRNATNTVTCSIESTNYVLSGEDTLVALSDGTNMFFNKNYIKDLNVNGNLDVSGILNMGSSGEIQHNGTPSIGYLDDGTPLFAKWLSGTIQDNLSNVSIPHGITNAYTNVRILGVTVHLQPQGTTITQVSKYDSYFYPYYTYYDNTNLVIYRGAGIDTVDRSVYAFLIYK